MGASDERYSPIARLIHWLTAILVLTMVPAGLVMIRIDSGPLQNQLFDYHRSVGIVLMILTLVRLGFRLTHKPAPLPEGMPLWQQFAAKATHAFLYGFLLAIVAKDRALADQLFQIHLVLGLLFTAAVGLHIAAALYHGLVRKDGVLGRMI